MNIVFTMQPRPLNPRLVWLDDYVAPWRDQAVLQQLPDHAWDGPVVRLVNDPTPAAPPQLLLQRARYFDYIGTNLSPHPCERTDAIGIAVFLTTADGRCVLQRRSPDLAIRPGRIGPGVSGTLEPSDLDGMDNLCEFLPHREIREELGVSDEDVHALRLMALIREPERNGAPELMYRGTLSLTAAELRRRPQTEGDLVFTDIMSLHDLPDATPPVTNLLHLVTREDMGR